MYLTIHNLFWLLLTGSVVGVLGAILGTGGGIFLLVLLLLGMGFALGIAG